MRDALHPLSFGVAMLVTFMHWMISPPDRSALVLHCAIDGAVAASMLVVADLLSVGGPALRYFRVPAELKGPWFDVRQRVRAAELGQVVLSRVAAVVAACVAFVVSTNHEWDPRISMAVLVAGFVGAQAGVLALGRAGTRPKLIESLSAHRAGLTSDRYEALALDLTQPVVAYTAIHLPLRF